jgi:hypothetical protein
MFCKPTSYKKVAGFVPTEVEEITFVVLFGEVVGVEVVVVVG